MLEVAFKEEIINPFEASPFNSKSEISTFKTSSLKVIKYHQELASFSTVIALIIGFIISYFKTTLLDILFWLLFSSKEIPAGICAVNSPCESGIISTL